MENLSGYTSTQLLKIGNDIKKQYDELKVDIVNETYLLQEVENRLNEKLSKFELLEKHYTTVINEINKR